MVKFNYKILEKFSLDAEIVSLLGRIHEAKGKQKVFLSQKPQELDKLIEIAKIQSTEASNEIEGIRTTNTRLKQLLLNKTAPKNRDEEEIAGYRDALNIIHENFEDIPVTPNSILQLHKILFARTGLDIGGRFKHVQNYISATGSDGEYYTIFTPLNPVDTPDAIRDICREFNLSIERGVVDPLILIPVFIHDFLCIHPFADGNGRMSRLLTTLLLYKSDYFVGRYISIESKIAKTKNEYYDSLEQSQGGWQNGEMPIPFLKYMLGIIVSAYRDFEERINLVIEKNSTLDIVRKVISGMLGKFTKADIINKCPNLSSKTIEKNLKILVDSREIEKHGSSRATYYTLTNKFN